MGVRNIEYHWPKNDQDFESACLVLLSEHFEDDNAQLLGRSGQKQHGCDIVGHIQGNPNRPFAVQCKLKGVGKGLSAEDINKEIGKLRSGAIRPEVYLIVTTAPDSTEHQTLAAQHTRNLQNDGWPTRVLVWAWRALQDQIHKYPKAQRAFDPYATSLFDERFDRLEIKLGVFGGDASSAPTVGALPRPQSANLITAAILSPLFKVANDEINAGRPAKAREILLDQKNAIETTASDEVLRKLYAQLGMCSVYLGETDEAIAYYEAAAAYEPNSPQAYSCRITALVLKEKYSEAAEYGRDILARQPDNTVVAFYWIQAVAQVEQSLELVDRIPAVIRNEPLIQSAIGHSLRQRRDTNGWYQWAHSETVSSSEDTLLKAEANVAYVDEVFSSSEFGVQRRLTESQISILESAVDVLLGAWETRVKGPSPTESTQLLVCSGLLQSLVALGRLDEARACAEETLKMGWTDPHTLQNIGIVALHCGDRAMLQGVAEKCEWSEDFCRIELMRCCQDGDWSGLAKLLASHRDKLDEEGRRICLVGQGFETTDACQGELKAESRFDELLEVAGEFVLPNILLAKYARTSGIESVSVRAYDAAFSAAMKREVWAERVTLAHESMARKKFAHIIELLLDVVDRQIDSEELRVLAVALANSQPARRSWADFWADIPDHIAQIEHYQCLHGVFWANAHDYSRAIDVLAPLALKTTDAQIVYILVSSLLAQGREVEAKEKLEIIDLDKLEGRPEVLAAIAHQLQHVGLAEDAIRFGYQAYERGRSCPRTVLSYVGLVYPGRERLEFLEPSQIEPEVWVEAENTLGDKWRALVTSGPTNLALKHYNVDHNWIQPYLGLCVGDTFDLTDNLLPTQTWTVTSITSKYVSAAIEAADSFQQWFPDEQGLWKFTTNPDDINATLDIVRRVTERAERVKSQYWSKQIPLAVLAAIRHESPVRTALAMTSDTDGIVSNLIAPKEQAKNRHLLLRTDTSAVIIDAYTAFVIRELRAFDVVRAVFDEIVIAPTHLLHIKAVAEDFAAKSDTLRMSWAGDRPIAHEITAKDNQNLYKHFIEVAEDVEAECSVEVPIAPDEIPSSAQSLLDLLGADVLAPAFLVKQGQLLLSEDLYLRNMCAGLLGVSGISLCALIEFAEITSKISSVRSDQLMVQLAARGHLLVDVNHRILWAALDDQHGDNLFSFKQTLRQFELSRLPPPRAMQIAAEFLEGIWGGSTSLPSLKLKHATSLFLDSITRAYKPTAQVLDALIPHVSEPCKRHILAWSQGHFIALSAD